MVEYVKMDKQGRITIPAQIRTLLSLVENNILEIDIQTNEIILRKKEKDNILKVEEWYQDLSNITDQANPIDGEFQESKWYSEDYVKQKLGL